LLTDYHLHLRPDADGTAPARYFTEENYGRYREAASGRGIEELGVAEHVHRFRHALEVWTHPFWKRWAVDDLDEYVEFVRGHTDLRLGIEADFVPGREDRMASLLDEHEWDYVVGSVHFIRDDAVDMRGEWDIWRTVGEPERVWTLYFEALGEAARTGMFDILAHPDLVKVWGGDAPLPEGDLRRFYDRAMDGIAESDVAIEGAPGCASRWARSTRRARSSRCAWRPDGRSRCRRTRTFPIRSATNTSAPWNGLPT
jgi:histidinol-phosphatase (PHP family)